MARYLSSLLLLTSLVLLENHAALAQPRRRSGLHTLHTRVCVHVLCNPLRVANTVLDLQASSSSVCSDGDGGSVSISSLVASGRPP